jgi:hypothetical protein
MELSLVPLTAIEGRTVDEFGDPAPGVFLRVSSQTTTVNPAAVRPPVMTGVTDDRGWFRVSSLLAGDYLVVALPEPFARSGPVAFPITAVPVQLGAGSDVHGINLVLPAVATTAVSGTVVDAKGQRRPKALVAMSPAVDKVLRASVNADANGNFVFPIVPTGTYLVEGRGDTFETGSVTITTPTEPFALVLTPLPMARGRVIFEGGTPPEVKGQMAQIFRYQYVRFQSAGVRVEEAIAVGRQGVVEGDWTFQIQGLSSPGFIRVNDGFSGWFLAKIVLNGRDITDVPYDFQSGDVDGIEVVMTRRSGGITGTINDFGIEPVAIVVFGADGDSWPYLSRTLRTFSPTVKGTFSLDGLVPGRYFVVAVRSGTPRSTPEALAALRSLAMLVVVSEGADTPVTVSIVKK